MANASVSKKPDLAPVVSTPAVAKPQPVSEVSTATTAFDSPARELQARLEAEVALEPKMSARSVTALVITVCLSTWLAGFWLYGAL